MKTKTKPQAKTYKTFEERNPDGRYVVLEKPVGRFKSGIHFMNCTFTPRGVFVQRRARHYDPPLTIASTQALLVPKEVVHATLAEAETYLAGCGTPCWLVIRKRTPIPGTQLRKHVVVQGHVKRHAFSYIYSGKERFLGDVFSTGGKPIARDEYATPFATEKEAVKDVIEQLLVTERATLKLAREATATRIAVRDALTAYLKRARALGVKR